MNNENIIDIMSIFNKLKNTPGKKDKENIIIAHKDNSLFIFILEFLCNKDKVTGVSSKKINKETTSINEKNFAVLYSIEDLIKFVLKSPTGSDIIIKSIQESINNFPKETHDFLKEVITKKFKCGVTAKTLNKAVPGTVKEFNVMLAEKYKDHEKMFINNDIHFAVTVKLDGIRVILERNKDHITFRTRQGKKIEGLVELEKEAYNLPIGMYDGELIATGTFNESQEQYKETMKRATIKGEKTNLMMKCFDIIDIDKFNSGIDNTPYMVRNEKLKNILRTYDENDYTIEDNYKFFKYHDPVYIGTDSEKIKELFEIAISFGEEGLMINVTDAPYECKRTKNLLKYKEFKTADVLITNLIEGTGKYKGTLGSITAECVLEIDGAKHPCISDIGSGFTDEQRKKYWQHPELILNQIAEIEYFEITNNEKGTYSLRFATWKDRIRIDKDTTHVD